MKGRKWGVSTALGRLRRAAAYVVLVGALILTGLAWYYVSQNLRAQEQARFDEAVQTTQWAIDRRMSAYVDAMLNVRGLFAASESVERDEFGKYVDGTDLRRRYPGVQAVGYSERVGSEEKDEFESEVREEGFSDYALMPDGERYEYFPIVYVEPSEGPNQRLLGYDAFAKRTQRAAMERARDTGLPAVSGRIALTGEDGEEGMAGFLIYLPVYRDGEPQQTASERRSALQGFVVSVFRADELLEGIFGGQADPNIDFEVFDGADLDDEHLLHDDDGVLRASDASHSPRFSDLTTLEVGGRIWSLYFDSLPSFESGWQSKLPLLVLFGGLLVSTCLFGVVRVLDNSRARAERIGAKLEETNRELEETNQELGETNQELEATNRELETFSYSVSHDLRTPLRGIDGFSHMLLEDYADELDDEGKDYLRRVRAGARRMGELIDALLSLSRLMRDEMRSETIDLSAMAGEISDDLRRTHPKREVEVQITPGLAANGDARLLQVALENLLGNAWKFTGEETHAKIEFGAVRRDGTPVYYVRDNGAGFDQTYAGKLFGPFQRLHRAGEFEGTGIGLATVQRVVHRHGGRIWAEGEVGRGATFYFTLQEGASRNYGDVG
jgi:signal transduction histidine kinase